LHISHYSTLSNFTLESVTAAQVGFNKIVSFVNAQSRTTEARHSREPYKRTSILINQNMSSGNPGLSGTISQPYKDKFLEYINNDLNTPKAIALIFDLLKDDTISNEDKKATILDFDTVLKLGFSSPVVSEETSVPQSVIDLAIRRKSARENKDFALADALREEIEKAGYVVKDTGSEEGFSLEKKL
jgi:cysteinyl-tRNA synthetase